MVRPEPRRLKILGVAILALCLCFTSAWAQNPPVFQSQGQEAQFNELIGELRCLVCQNQNLADSDAPLAADLREQILEQMYAGRSNEEIKQYLVERYGDFVLYNPPVQGNTLVLWFAPLILLLIGALVVAVNIRKRARMAATETTEGNDPT